MTYNIHDFVEEINKLHSHNSTKEIYKAKVEGLEPLIIRANGMIFDKNINATTWGKIVINGVSTTSNSQHSHKLNLSPLKVGDTLLVYFNQHDNSITILDKVEVV